MIILVLTRHTLVVTCDAMQEWPTHAASTHSHANATLCYPLLQLARRTGLHTARTECQLVVHLRGRSSRPWQQLHTLGQRRKRRKRLQDPGVSTRQLRLGLTCHGSDVTQLALALRTLSQSVISASSPSTQRPESLGCATPSQVRLPF